MARQQRHRFTLDAHSFQAVNHFGIAFHALKQPTRDRCQAAGSFHGLEGFDGDDAAGAFPRPNHSM